MRFLTILAYKNTAYYYDMVAVQFGIAEAAYHGHAFSYDEKLFDTLLTESNTTRRYIPLEDWAKYARSGEYRTFPARDLPGFGYLIALTSKLFDRELTTKYAFAIQIMIEMSSVLVFAYCVYLVLGARIALLSGLLYIFGYPFIWPLASQPMRDIFVLAIYSSYIAAFFIFLRRNDVYSYAAATMLVILSACLLWFRPAGYYFYFLISPLIFFANKKSIRARWSFFAITILLPVLLFTLPLRGFNIRHYGMTDTDLIGRALWEGMGIIKDNPYGFVLDDNALVPWVKEYYKKDVSYSSPEMNRLLGNYAREIIQKDPLFYARTVLTRSLTMIISPLIIPRTGPMNLSKIMGFKQSELPFMTYVTKYPKDFILNLCRYILFDGYGVIFFYAGVLLAFLMFRQIINIRLEMLILMAPLFYTLVTQIPLHFEHRYLATGAWVLILPLAWYVDKLISDRKKRYPINWVE